MAYPLHLQRWVDIAITSLTLGMCSRTWLQSSAPPYPPPPQLRVCCYSSTQFSVHKTLTHIHNSGFIACLQANRSLSLILYLETVLLSYTLIYGLVTVFVFSFWIAQSWHWKRQVLHLGGISVVYLSFFINFAFFSFINWTRVSCKVICWVTL